MNSGTLRERVALITGAGRSPAPAIARRLAQQGATIAANDLSPTLLDPLLQAGRPSSGQIKSYVADATRGMPLRAMLDEILEDWGRIDILVNNPRIRPDAPLIEMDEWDWQRTVEMNLNGPFLITQLVARLMREQGGGVVLNIVDCDPRMAEAAGGAAYAASQQGLLALSQAAARELLSYNIRVYTLCPDRQALDGEAFPSGIEDGPGEEKGRTSGEVLAHLAAFLCSPAASGVDGQIFRISGSQVTPKLAARWNASLPQRRDQQE